MASSDASSSSSLRPAIQVRGQTSPNIAMNGHFASSNASSSEQYEHGVQVIDADKNFK